MAQQIELLFARRFRRAERLFLGHERLQAAKTVLIFLQDRLGVRESVEQVQLALRREQRLVIVRAV